MSKYELSLAKDYVPSWTTVDAVRELFQNALDQQTTVADNRMFFKYIAPKTIAIHDLPQVYEPGVLRIGNKASVLEAKTLLLGSSTKANDPNTIGQFGEGYKVATLVLVREGKKVTFYNYGKREVWSARFVKSRKYSAEVLTFDIDKKFLWQSVPDNNFTIEVEGITEAEYNDIVASNLHLQSLEKVIETGHGRILLDENQAGKVHVNGLFVCNYDYHHGYDFKPSKIKLDRDRKMADPFQLKWLSSNMWADALGKHIDNAIEPFDELVDKNANDTLYVNSHLRYAITTNIMTTVTDRAYDNFKEKHGANAVPVTTNEELSVINTSKYKPVITNEVNAQLIKSSPKYESPQLVKIDPVDTLIEWLDKHKQSLSKRAITDLQSIIEEMRPEKCG